MSSNCDCVLELIPTYLWMFLLNFPNKLVIHKQNCLQIGFINCFHCPRCLQVVILTSCKLLSSKISLKLSPDYMYHCNSYKRISCISHVYHTTNYSSTRKNYFVASLLSPQPPLHQEILANDSWFGLPTQIGNHIMHQKPKTKAFTVSIEELKSLQWFYNISAKWGIHHRLRVYHGRNKGAVSSWYVEFKSMDEDMKGTYTTLWNFCTF